MMSKMSKTSKMKMMSMSSASRANGNDTAGADSLVKTYANASATSSAAPGAH